MELDEEVDVSDVKFKFKFISHCLHLFTKENETMKYYSCHRRLTEVLILAYDALRRHQVKATNQSGFPNNSEEQHCSEAS